MFDLNDCMAFVTSRSGKIFAAAMEKQLNQYHMTRTQWIAMYYILSKGPLTQKQLAEQMVLRSAGKISGIIGIRQRFVLKSSASSGTI